LQSNYFCEKLRINFIIYIIALGLDGMGLIGTKNMEYGNWAKRELCETGIGRNGNWAKWELGEMGIGRNGNWAKRELGEMGIGRNGNWAKREDTMHNIHSL
jgi:hypothetical protein